MGTINVILAALGRTGTSPSRVLFVTQLPTKEPQPEPKRAKKNFHPTLSFLEEDKIETTQPHDDALLITLRIGDYDVKRVMVDVGSAAEVIYPDLYKGLNLKLEDLMPYSSPLMSFDGKLVIPKGMIRLPIQTGPEIVEVNFIVMDTYSSYTAIVIWNTILRAFDIKYMSRTSIRGQVLADLVVEFAEPPVEVVAGERSIDGKPVGAVSMPGPLCWKVYVDGAANQRGFGVGLVLESPEKTIIEKSLRLGFSATNNEAEYEALLQGMAMVQKMGGTTVEMFSDSKLVVG